MKSILCAAVLLSLFSMSAFGQELSAADRQYVSERAAKGCEDAEGFGPGECVELVEGSFHRAYERCQAVVPVLKDSWLYFDDFEIYAVSYSGGGDVEHSSCTIHATNKANGTTKHVRISASQRSDSDRFQYERLRGNQREDCKKLYLTDCLRNTEGAR